MSAEGMRECRRRYNEQMAEADSFFREFGVLDGEVYPEVAIVRKHKELMGMDIFVATRCNEYILAAWTVVRGRGEPGRDCGGHKDRGNGGLFDHLP